MDIERHLVDGANATELRRDLHELESDAVGVAAVVADIRELALVSIRPDAGQGLRALRGRTLEEHGAQELWALQQFGCRSVESHLALFQEHSPFCERDGNVDGLLDEHHGRAALMDGSHDSEQLFDDDRREPEAQLVDHQQRRLGQECLAEREHLLLTAREVARALVPPLAQHREEFEDLFGRGLQVLGLLGVQPTGELEVLRDGERGEHTLAARHHHDPVRHGLGRRLAGDVVAVVSDRARARLHEAADGRQQRRFASTVRAQQRDDLAA